jgi:alpha-ketoglutarate-dependent taurine dioxygenase
MTPDSPFSLDNPSAYAAWRERKLIHQPASPEELVVEVKDPSALTPGEREALQSRIHRCNMAVYVSPDCREDAGVPRRLASQFGLHRLDANWLADEDGISRIQVNAMTETRGSYIPYTNRPIKWHTDGYYNTADRMIRGMVLHCVRNAASGGINRLMDPEMAYLQLRDRNPDHIRALMQPDAMRIPERVDEQDGIRPEQTGPVFSVDEATGSLHMRYTARTRSIAWKTDEATQAAVAALEELLTTPAPWIFAVQLLSGMGLLSNNVLHDRSGFTDSEEQPRLIYRARYYDRITAA